MRMMHQFATVPSAAHHELQRSVLRFIINHHRFRDLLSKDGEKLDIKINPDGTGQLHVPGLRTIEVKSFQHIKKVTQHAAHLQ